MITIEDLKKELDLIKDNPKFQKMLDFASILTSFFEQEKIKPIPFNHEKSTGYVPMLMRKKEAQGT